ncbi:MAG: cysteine desulfurase [Lachnospiraceae bacterium]|nr:cysteine desulfurase [Candidatus Equihabitans merdae]
MRDIYFDNASTTRPSDGVREIVMKCMTEDYGNPSSMHQKGVESEAYLKKAAADIARIMKVKDKEIIFTSCGTESNNTAILGTAAALKRQGNTIITTVMEHPAVSEPLKFLAEQGFNIVRIPIDSNGQLDMAALENALNEDVILVSMMYVNNEVGAVTPVEKIGRLVHEKCPKAYYHVDGIQAFGHFKIFPKDVGIDMMSASAHKFHGPKGVGFLYVSEKCRIRPLLLGGGQQSGMRSGTDNVPGVAGMGVAAVEAYAHFDEWNEKILTVKKALMDGLKELPDVALHTGDEGFAPHIVNAAFSGVGSEVLLHSLEDRGIYVSAGSACSTHKRAPSPTLSALKIPKPDLSSSVRFSFCETNTVEEVEYTLQVLKELLPMLRRYRAH